MASQAFLPLLFNLGVKAPTALAQVTCLPWGQSRTKYLRFTLLPRRQDMAGPSFLQRKSGQKEEKKALLSTTGPEPDCLYLILKATLPVGITSSTLLTEKLRLRELRWPAQERMHGGEGPIWTESDMGHLCSPNHQPTGGDAGPKSKCHQQFYIFLDGNC